ncbi:hypothetical protein BMF94_3383 [Rhodotorula taiwanensis]|uniref:Uncharacterized protein n=1 Tax=Rhodotorula taiwanensis TaxID=741276 RepID=A0A2S5B9J4_9BASI|nr:hypothetical protein BMF94_3383 [Rhodotorula taiwanensis]
MLGWSSQLGNRLFGPDPKLEFRKPGQGLDLLAANQAIPPESEAAIPVLAPIESSRKLTACSQYLTLFDSPTDVVLLLPASQLDRALRSNPLNLVTLIRYCVQRLEKALTSGHVGSSSDDRERQVLNAVRVLSCVVPLVLAPREPDGSVDEFEEALFWSEDESEGLGQSQGDDDAREGQFVLADEDEEEGDSIEAQQSRAAAPPLAKRLLGALVDLLFLPGLTLPRSIASEGAGVVHAIWCAPTTPLPPPPISILNARLEILRLLTLLVSLPSVLTAPGLFLSTPNRWRDALVSGRVVNGNGDKKVVLCLLCSLLNTALAASSTAATRAVTESPTSTFDSLRDRAARLAAETAKTASAATGLHAADEASVKEALVDASLQLLGAVLIEHASDEATVRNNLFEYYVSRLHRPADFELLANGFTGSLVAALVAVSSAPGLGFGGRTFSSTSPHALEALTVLFRLIDSNRKFSQWLVQTPMCLLRVMVTIEASLVEWASDESRVGLVRLASLAMQTLTAEVGAQPSDELLRALNAPLEPRVIGPALAGVVQRQLAQQGLEADAAPLTDSKTEPRVFTFNEYLLISLHALVLPATITTGAAGANYRATLATLYSPLLLAVNNLSCLMREIGNEAATRLVRVWLAFSAPSWVLMEEGNPRLVYCGSLKGAIRVPLYLLETFNNVTAHNLDRNPYIVYALAVSFPRLELLANFTLAVGVTEARRLKSVRRERLRPISEASDAIEGPPRPITDSAGPSAKALGKRRASSVSLSGLSLNEPTLPSPALSRSGSSTSLGASNSRPDSNEPFVGRNGFVPTESWVASWREGLPLDALLILLSEVRQKLIDCSSDFPATRPSTSTIASLRADLVMPAIKAMLPTDPSTKTRRFVASASSSSWLASVVYSRIYLAQIDYLRDSLPVQLFAVAHAPKRTPRLGQIGVEMERVGRSAAQVGGRVGGVLSGVLGGLGGGR